MYLPFYLLKHDKKIAKMFQFAIFENPSKDLLNMIQIQATDLPKMFIFIQNPDNQDSSRPLPFASDFVYSKMKRFLNGVYIT